MTPAPMTPNRSDLFAPAFAPDADVLEFILSASSSALPSASALSSTLAILQHGLFRGSPSTSPHMWRMPRDNPRHVLSPKITLIRHSRECWKWAKRLGSNPKQPAQLR